MENPAAHRIARTVGHFSSAFIINTRTIKPNPMLEYPESMVPA